MLLTLVAATPPAISPVSTRDRKVVQRWALPGGPRGVALGGDGSIYVGLAHSQTIVAIDPKSGTIRKSVVLDSAEIAATKELVTLRTNPDRTLLYVANGSDESATILTLPDLTVVREITIEGEPIRDALPDPAGRYLYLLGRKVHVFDARGEAERKAIDVDDPMAIATNASGTTLAVIASEDFGNTRATVIILYDAATLAEIAREPLQTDRRVETAHFAAGDRALVAVSRDYLFEKPLLLKRAPKGMTSAQGGAMRMTIDFGDLVNSEKICLPEKSGPQIAALASDVLLLLAERRCSSSGAFAGTTRRVTPASLYGVSAFALAYDASANTVVATDPDGFVTIYRAPKPPVVSR